MLPASWSPEKTDSILKLAFDGTAVVKDGKIVFDNRDYDFVHFGSALESVFGRDAFGTHRPGVGPPQFPTLLPITKEGRRQKQELGALLTAQHVGKQASWGGTSFGNLGFLRGKNSAVGGEQSPVVEDWILR